MFGKRFILIFSMSVCIFALLGIGFGYFISTLYELPRIEQLHNYNPSQKTTVYASEGEIIAEFFIEKREVIPLSQIPPLLQKAFIAAEDHRFYSHPGLDIIRLAKVLLVNFPHWSRAQATSSITQQLARNLFLTQERTLSRKIRELILAIQIEKKYSKNEILEMYLNKIYFAHGIYGVAEASSFYFGKLPEKLTLAECAIIASIPKSPGSYSPVYNPENTRVRRDYILRRMYEVGFITEPEMRTAQALPLDIVEDQTRADQRHMYKAPYFAELVRQSIAEKYGYEMLWKGGLKVYTTLDIEMQDAAENAILPYLKKNDFQGALLAMDPSTGQIKAMVGGKDFNESQFNRATQARRQTGSAFKIFTYTAAIDSGKFNAVSPFFDGPIVYRTAGQSIWSPENYEKEYWGDVNLWQMLAHSINVASVKLLSEVGVSNVIRYARKMGIESPLSNNLTLTLGTSSNTVLEMVRSYSTIANYGIKMNPMYITKVGTSRGIVLEENFPKGEKVISAQAAFCMIDLLKKAVDMGTGGRIRWLGFDRPCAGKTGTVGWPGEKNTNKTMDAWFIGFTPELVAGVWIGKDDSSPLGSNLTGNVAAVPVWTEFMKSALQGKPVRDFLSPSGVVFKRIDIDTGYLATDDCENTEWFAFLEENVPHAYCPQHTKGGIQPARKVAPNRFSL